MSRWEPDAGRRLQDAALALFTERGYAETTVAAIAERAGLTERTFFRHFDDKREVLFGDDAAWREQLADAIAAAPAGRSPAALVAAGFDALADDFETRRAALRRRARLLARHPDLGERELAKLIAWETTLAEALRARGHAAAEAELAAALGVATFRVALRRWSAASR